MRPPQGWEEIRAEVLRRIDRRDWRPGATIPTEEQLAAEFGCARATVSRALRELAGAGVLERRRKAGTRVATHPVRKATLDIPVIRLEVEGRGQAYGFRLIDRATAVPPPAVAARLGLAPGQRLDRFRTLHLADGRPTALEDRWLNLAVLPEPPPADVSLNEWLVKTVAYTYGDISFSAEAATPDEALLLETPAGAALFITERTTWAGEAPITSVRLAHAPGYRLRTVV